MRIAFLSLPVPGHLNPMTALARKFQARGHSVVFLSLPDVAQFVQAAQLPFVPCSEDAYPQGSFGKYVQRLSRLFERRFPPAELEAAFSFVKSGSIGKVVVEI